MTSIRMYDDLAPWWPLISPPADYAEEAALYTAALRSFGDTPAQTLLELGSGGGNNASHMQAHFDLTLVDPAPGMLAHSRALNAACEHIEGDMRTCRLGRTFDRVFIQDAIVYMLTEADLRLALETAFVHCRPGGAALFAPDHVRETFSEGTDDGGADAGGRGLRYLEWTWDPDPNDTQYTVDYAYMLREADGTVTVAHDRHLEGLFPRATWLRLLGEVGFEAHRVPFEHSDLESGTYEGFVGVRPRR